jgi:hypothetical protein
MYCDGRRERQAFSRKAPIVICAASHDRGTPCVYAIQAHRTRRRGYRFRKLGHCAEQIRTVPSELGQYPAEHPCRVQRARRRELTLFHAAMALWPKGLAAAFNNRATWTADHLPPRAAGMPPPRSAAVSIPDHLLDRGTPRLRANCGLIAPQHKTTIRHLIGDGAQRARRNSVPTHAGERAVLTRRPSAQRSRADRRPARTHRRQPTP